MNAGLKTALSLAVALAVHGCKCTPDLDNDNDKDKDPPDPTPTDSWPDTGDVDKPCAYPEQEPNNTDAEANELPLEQIGCGTFSEAGDIDVFVADVVEEGWLSVATAGRSIGSFADIQFVLEPPDGSAAVRTDDEGTTDASLLFPGTPGRWELQLSEQNFTGGDVYFYQVSVSSAKAPLEWTATEVEPNNDLASAMPVAHGDVVFGDMDDNLDGDWYRIDVPPGKHTLIADVTAYSVGSSGDFVIYLADVQQRLLPLGCNPNGNCGTFGDPIDPGLRDPLLEYESQGNESLFVKVGEEQFHWGRHTWYVISFSLVGT